MIVFRILLNLIILCAYLTVYGMFANDEFSMKASSSHKSRPLNILFVVGHFPAPSQIFILNIMTGLIDKGHNVLIYSVYKDEYENIHPNIKKYGLLDRVFYGKFPFDLSECDIVFCQFGYLGTKIIKMKNSEKWLKKRKVVVCFRGADITSYLQKDQDMYTTLFVQGDLFLPVCDYFKNRLIDLGCDSNKIIVHHSAIDCAQFFFKTRRIPKDGIIRCVSVCRLVEKKGIDFAIKALARVVQKHPNIHFTIVGDGPERKSLEQLAKKLKIEDKIVFHGWATQAEVVSILNRSHIFLLPSRTGSDGNEEGIPNALKEAMATGLISVGTWHAGNSELIQDKVSGFLVAEKNEIELAQAIEHIIEHPELWESIGRAARKTVKDQFETKRSIEKLEKIFYWLLNVKKTNDHNEESECI